MIQQCPDSSTEEFWFYAALRGCYGSFQSLYVVPSVVEQGNCFMFVYWSDYHVNSVFKRSIFHLNGVSHLRGQNFRTIPAKLLQDLNSHPTFFFLRKVHSDSGTTVVTENGTRLTVRDAYLKYAML